MQRFQTGGTVNFHAIANTARAGEDADTTTTQASSKKQSLISDSLMKSLYTEGIPVDVDWLSGKIANLEHREAMGLGVSSSEVQAINAQINRVVQNAKYLEAAEKQAIKNDALADVAVDDKGYMYVMTEKGLDKKHFSKFNAEKEQALTVSDLINYRKNVPSLAFNNDYIQTISTSIGTTKIQEYITGILSSIGDSTSATDAYTNLATILGRDAKKLTEQEYKALASMAQVAQQVGLDAVLKESIKSKDSNMQAALGYLQRVLPRNMQYQLKAQYVAAGGDADDNNIGELLTYAGATYNKSSREYSVDYEKGMNDAAGRVTDDTKTQPQTTMEMFFNRNLNRVPGGVIISDPEHKNRYALRAQGSVAASLLLDNGSGVGDAPLDIALDANGKGVGKYLDTNQVWFGTDKTSREALSKVYYTGSQMANVDLPVDGNGNINWEALHNYSTAEELISQQNITDIDTKNKIHEECGSYIRYAADGSQQSSLPTAQFMMTHGITSDDYVSSDNQMYNEIGRDREKLYDEKIKSINKQYKSNLEKSGWFTDMVEIPIFIKIQPNAGMNAAYFAHHGSMVPKRTLEQDMISQQMQEPPTMQVQGNASLLYQE